MGSSSGSGCSSLVDAAVTSARAGARKPHPGIYAASMAALGVDAADVVFVGDSWEPDVRGPRRHRHDGSPRLARRGTVGAAAAGAPSRATTGWGS